MENSAAQGPGLFRSPWAAGGAFPERRVRSVHPAVPFPPGPALAEVARSNG